VLYYDSHLCVVCSELTPGHCSLLEPFSALGIITFPKIGFSVEHFKRDDRELVFRIHLTQRTAMQLSAVFIDTVTDTVPFQAQSTSFEPHY